MISIVTLEGTTHALPKAVAVRSLAIKNILEAGGSDADDTPIPVSVSDADFDFGEKFLTLAHAERLTNPFVRIERPLKIAASNTVVSIVDSGVPAWASEFVDTIPFASKIVDVIDAANTLQIKQ